ncbi:hypothetical protein [Paracoccus pantotrophus]|uniref:hypothetical protein n=1 Tax=Paracoccus pantotrophus TaxID=82367 RepID=UPI00048C8BE0|nr:hypothetical protein [Paracoccus pantotrophus]
MDDPAVAEDLLTTDEALDFLRRRKIFTSRSGLDRAYHEGRLARVAAHGRVRILYRPRDLLDAFLIGEQKCLSSSSSVVKSGIS